MLLAEFYNQILTEADLPPGELAKLHNDITRIRRDTDTISAEHNAFFKKLTKEIINNNVEGYKNDITGKPEPLLPYNVRKSWVDEPEVKAQDFEYVKRKAPEQAEAILAVPDDSSFNPEFKPGTVKVHMVYMDAVDGEIAMWVSKLFGGEDAVINDEDFGDGPGLEPGQVPGQAYFRKFWDLVHDEQFMNNADPSIVKKLTAIKQKYIAGTYNLYNLEKTTKKLMTDLGQTWKHDKVERARLEADAPIIMKFDNGYMWVRLDSTAEMKREGDMMQNCISGYCPVGERVDMTFGLGDEYVIDMDEAASEDYIEAWLVGANDENDPDGEMEEMGFDVGWPERNGFDGVKGYIADKKLKNPELFDRIDEYWLDRMTGTEENAVKWMVEQMVELDRDAEGRFVAGNLIYSLRDKNGESHVSAEYDPNNHEIGTTEARGKQNEPATEKYKPYIAKLDAFFIQHPEKFGPR